MNNQSHDDAGQNSCYRRWAQSYSCLKSIVLLDFLEKEIQELLESVESTPREEHV